jgi:hypothetical protein
MTTINNETKVRALLSAGKTSESVVDYLVMNDDYRTKPEARTALEAFMTDNKLVPEKKVPMSQQYEAWYKALSREDKLAQTKKTLHDQAVTIGMSDKSADWYARVYELAGRLALEMSQAIEPADQAPSTRAYKTLLKCDGYDMLDAWVLANTKAGAFTKQAVEALTYAADQVDTELSVMILSTLTW